MSTATEFHVGLSVDEFMKASANVGSWDDPTRPGLTKEILKLRAEHDRVIPCGTHEQLRDLHQLYNDIQKYRQYF